jgi:hypothetical protein
VWAEIRQYFGADCNSVRLAGDRLKSAQNLIEAQQARIERVKGLAKKAIEDWTDAPHSSTSTLGKSILAALDGEPK